MRALTLHQPFASFIARGVKKYETRSWTTKYRGPLLIHAGKSKEHLSLVPYADIQELGVVVAVATLEGVYPVEDISPSISWGERAIGDWSPGRYAWELKGVRRLAEPIPYRGRQGLWRPPNSLVDLVAMAMKVE